MRQVTTTGGRLGGKSPVAIDPYRARPRSEARIVKLAQKICTNATIGVRHLISGPALRRGRQRWRAGVPILGHRSQPTGPACPGLTLRLVA
jgi:hypothetical protein